MSSDLYYNFEKERREAIEAGNAALYSLNAAYDELRKARGWGIVDMFGGGFISTLVKHSKMENAQAYMDQARQDLYNFSRELRDVQMSCNLNIETDDFLSFADWFWDGFAVDFMVQSRIVRAQEQIERAIYMVQDVLNRLNGTF